MKTTSCWPVILYARMLRFYPPSFRAEYEEEMLFVFSQAVAESARRGKAALAGLFLREALSWPRELLVVYRDWLAGLVNNEISPRVEPAWNSKLESGKRDPMDPKNKNAGWSVHNRRQALLAALPPLLFGLGIGISWLVIGRQWQSISRLQLYAGIGAGFLAAAVIAVGALFALLKGLPDWGYMWVGSALLGFVLLLQTAAEELAESGLYHLSAGGETAVEILILLLFLAFLSISAWRGWQCAGMASIGMSSILAVSLYHVVAVPPLNRPDMAALAIPYGALVAGLVYLFLRRSSTLWQAAALLFIGLVNLAAVMTVDTAWQALLDTGKPFPILPFAGIISGLLLAGPLLSLAGRPVRRRFRRE